MDLSPEEEAERQEIIGMSDKARSKALVAVLRSEGELASLATPRGFLLTGPPGTGKSLLMDIFFESLPIPHKVRFHYHQCVVSLLIRSGSRLLTVCVCKSQLPTVHLFKG